MRKGIAFYLVLALATIPAFAPVVNADVRTSTMFQNSDDIELSEEAKDGASVGIVANPDEVEAGFLPVALVAVGVLIAIGVLTVKELNYAIETYKVGQQLITMKTDQDFQTVVSDLNEMGQSKFAEMLVSEHQKTGDIQHVKNFAGENIQVFKNQGIIEMGGEYAKEAGIALFTAGTAHVAGKLGGHLVGEGVSIAQDAATATMGSFDLSAQMDKLNENLGSNYQTSGQIASNTITGGATSSISQTTSTYSPIDNAPQVISFVESYSGFNSATPDFAGSSQSTLTFSGLTGARTGIYPGGLTQTMSGRFGAFSGPANTLVNLPISGTIAGSGLLLHGRVQAAESKITMSGIGDFRSALGPFTINSNGTSSGTFLGNTFDPGTGALTGDVTLNYTATPQ